MTMYDDCCYYVVHDNGDDNYNTDETLTMCVLFYNSKIFSFSSSEWNKFYFLSVQHIFSALFYAAGILKSAIRNRV